MSHQPDRPRSRTSNKKELPSLKKLPSKKAAAKKKKTETNIRLEAKTRKDFSSTIALIKRKLSHVPVTKMPADLKPMLATLVDEPFTDSNWQFELKLDGYRALAYIQNGKAELRSRNNNSFNKKFFPVISALTDWKINAVCTVEGNPQPMEFAFTVSGDTLTIKDDTGTQDLLKCP